MATLLTAKQMASELGLRAGTIKQWARSGKIPSLRLSGKVIRFDREAVEQALRDHAQQTRANRGGWGRGWGPVAQGPLPTIPV